MAFQLLQILPGVIAKIDPKKKPTAKMLDAIFKLPGMFGGAFKSPSTGTPTPTEGTGLQINPPINNEGVQQGIFNRPKNILGIPGQEDSIYNIFGA